MYLPYASWCVTHGHDHDQYYIRFNLAAARCFEHMSIVELSKTVDNKYIIIKPIKTTKVEPWMNTIRKTKSGAQIYVSGRVTDGFLKPEWFDKRRCRIKKDRDGNIYICREEMVTNE